MRREPNAPVLSLEEARAFVAGRRAAGHTVVFTNGVFDLVHPGHVRYLQAARREGDALVVAVNSDRSVRAIKGPERPLIPERERAELLASFSFVDAVFVFDDETPARVIEVLAPDVLVKGEDWAADRIVGRDTVEGRGGRVVRARLADGYSTTDMVARMKKTGQSKS